MFGLKYDRDIGDSAGLYTLYTSENSPLPYHSTRLKRLISTGSTSFAGSPSLLGVIRAICGKIGPSRWVGVSGGGATRPNVECSGGESGLASCGEMDRLLGSGNVLSAGVFGEDFVVAQDLVGWRTAGNVSSLVSRSLFARQ